MSWQPENALPPVWHHSSKMRSATCYWDSVYAVIIHCCSAKLMLAHFPAAKSIICISLIFCYVNWCNFQLKCARALLNCIVWRGMNGFVNLRKIFNCLHIFFVPRLLKDDKIRDCRHDAVQKADRTDGWFSGTNEQSQDYVQTQRKKLSWGCFAHQGF